MNKYMELTLIEAKKASIINEVPVGAVIVYNNKVIAKAHNLRQKKKNVLAHAEILAIEHASKKLKTWHLDGCILYVSMKPCRMCEEVIKQSRIKQIYYIVDNNKEINYSLNYIQDNTFENEYKTLIDDFFNKLRN
jgi:tRNA(adenine34) deaminase